MCFRLKVPKPELPRALASSEYKNAFSEGQRNLLVKYLATLNQRWRIQWRNRRPQLPKSAIAAAKTLANALGSGAFSAEAAPEP